jgi:hypothetical protein
MPLPMSKTMPISEIGIVEHVRAMMGSSSHLKHTHSSQAVVHEKHPGNQGLVTIVHMPVCQGKEESLGSINRQNQME